MTSQNPLSTVGTMQIARPSLLGGRLFFVAAMFLTTSALAESWPLADAAHGMFSVGTTPYSSYGTTGALVGVTASTSSGNPVITLSPNHGLSSGQYISITGVPYSFIINTVSATSATLNRAPTATVTNAAVGYAHLPDPQMVLGYNQNRLSNPSEPEWIEVFEADFLDTDGYRRMENYLQFTPANGATKVRPYLFAVNRDTDTYSYGYLRAGTDFGLMIKNTLDRNIAQFLDSKISLNAATTTRQASGAVGNIATWIDGNGNTDLTLTNNGTLGGKIANFNQIGAEGPASSFAAITAGAGGNTLASSTQIGVFLPPFTANSAATAAVRGVQIGVATAPSNNTLDEMSGLYVGGFSLGSGSSATRSYKMRAWRDLAAINNVGYFYGTSGTWTGNWGLYFDAADPNYLAGGLSIGSAADPGAGNLTVFGGKVKGGASGLNLSAGGTNQSITLSPSGAGSIAIGGPVAFSVDGANDIGAASAGRPRNYYGTGDVRVGGNVSAGTANFSGVVSAAGFTGAGSANFGGSISAQSLSAQSVASGSVASSGPLAGYSVQDRTTGNQTFLYSSGDTFRIAGATQDRWTIDAVGNSSFSGNISPIINGGASLGTSNNGWRQLHIAQTLTPSGRTGNATLTTAAGSVRVASGQRTVTVTDSLCSRKSLVFAVVRTADATAYVKNVVPADGSFVVNLGAAATAETEIGFHILNE